MLFLPKTVDSCFSSINKIIKSAENIVMEENDEL